jgi:hypothetical protein
VKSEEEEKEEEREVKKKGINSYYNKCVSEK